MRLEEKLEEFREGLIAKSRERAMLALSNVMKTIEGRLALGYVVDQTGLMAPELWVSGVELNRAVAVRDFGAQLVHDLYRANPEACTEFHRDAWRRASEMLRDIETFEKENR
jgi:hypothetical protein